MTADQAILFGLLGVVFALLLWGRVRYDVVAFGALVVGATLGVVPQKDVFAGLGHPATVIVGLVLIVSRGLMNSGAIEWIARVIADPARALPAHIGVMSGIASALSGVMNNVATLALLMPIDLKTAARAGRSPALTLMPLSFATILGGMVTLIGTPPNIVVATVREASAIGEPFSMFAFTPVGVVVAIAGVLFVALVGWRLIPRARGEHDSGKELMELSDYVAEARVPAESSSIDETLDSLESLATANEVELVGLVRRGKRLSASASSEPIRRGDVVVMEGGPHAIEQFVAAAKLEYIRTDKRDGLLDEAFDFVEVVVPASARIVGRSALDVRLLYRQRVTLLGVSRRGKRFSQRVRKLKIRAGDVLLLLGPADRMSDVIQWLGCLPLAERGLQVTQRHKAPLAVGIFAAAITVASLGWLYLPVALAAVAVLYVLLRILPLTQIYESVEWPVIVLLGSLIPIGSALESSGGTELIARHLVDLTSGFSPVVVLGVLMVVTMTLSDVLNNVATALIAAPIGIDVARKLDVNPDPFLMAVAVAASCAFLTPIGHKNNTIIMGPGGYRFGDYWRMGLPLEVLVIAVGLPTILVFWPL